MTTILCSLGSWDSTLDTILTSVCTLLPCVTSVNLLVTDPSNYSKYLISSIPNILLTLTLGKEQLKTNSPFSLFHPQMAISKLLFSQFLFVSHSTISPILLFSKTYLIISGSHSLIAIILLREEISKLELMGRSSHHLFCK